MSVKGLLHSLMELIGAALFGTLFGASFLFAILYFEENIFHDSVFWNIAAGILGAIIGSTVTVFLSEESRKNQIKLAAKVAANNLDYYLNDLSSLSIKLLTLETFFSEDLEKQKDTDLIDDLIPSLDLTSIMRALDEFIIILNNDSARLLKEEVIDLSRKLERAKNKVIDYINAHNHLSRTINNPTISLGFMNDEEWRTKTSLSNQMRYFNSVNLSRQANMSMVISLVDLTRDKLFSFQKKFLF